MAAKTLNWPVNIGAAKLLPKHWCEYTRNIKNTDRQSVLSFQECQICQVATETLNRPVNTETAKLFPGQCTSNIKNSVGQFLVPKSGNTAKWPLDH